MTENKETKDKSSVGQYVDLGLQFALAILLCTGGGYWLDSKMNTLPLFLILGLLLGATSGFITIYRAVYSKGKEKPGKGE